LLTGLPDEPIYLLAHRLQPGYQEALVIVDPQSRPLGVVTEADLTRMVATGRIDSGAPARKLMSKPPLTAPPELTAGEVVLLMMRHRHHHVVVTEDGSANSRVIGILGEKSIQMLHGTVPTFLAKEIMIAQDVADLKALRDRADQMLVYFLSGDPPVEWVSEFVAIIDDCVVERAAQLAKQNLASEGLAEPTTDFAWLAFHSDGRKERFLRSAQRTGIVYQDVSPDEEAEVRRWFLAFGAQVTSLLAACGFPLEPRGLMANNPDWVQPFSRWKELYHTWITQPVESNIITLTPFFDFRATMGSAALAEALHENICEEVRANPYFIPLLANDARANLPPITIFRDTVMDQAGTLWTCIDTKLHALLPLVDYARVFALADGLQRETFTYVRLLQLAERRPAQAEAFEAAAEAFRRAIYVQTRAGLKRGDDGQLIRPEELDRLDIQRMKTVFRSIVRLMEVMSEVFDITTEKPVGEAG